MGNGTGGMISGLVVGALVVATMLPMQFPNKPPALLAAFIRSFGIGLVIRCVPRPWPGWLIGLVFGLLPSIPEALITKAYAPILNHRPYPRRDHRRYSRRLEMTMGAGLIALVLTSALLVSGCGGTDRRQQVNPAATTAAPAIALLSEASTGTIHFPRGLYSLESKDSHGYYYRAPGKVYQRSFSGLLPHDGGIFVSKQNQKKLRGYVVMPSGVTHVGNLSGANYQFRYQ